MSKSRVGVLIAPLMALAMTLGLDACATSDPVADVPYAAVPVGPPGPDDAAATCCYYDWGLDGFVDFDGGWYRTWNRGWGPWHRDPANAPWHAAGMGRAGFGDGAHGNFAFNSAAAGRDGFGHAGFAGGGFGGFSHGEFTTAGLGHVGFGGFGHGGFGGGHGGR